MKDAWWGPTSMTPDGTPFFHVGERGYPGAIMVNAAGQRFTNESAAYTEVVHDMHEKHTDENPHVPALFIMDSRFRDTYLFGTLFPGQSMPREYIESGDL